MLILSPSKMARYFLHLSYLGSNYHGWQRQPNSITVQEVIEAAIRQLGITHDGIHGCGRTDTGVHASDFYAHVDLDLITDLSAFRFQLNAVLAQDIAIIEVIEVANHAHARFDASERKYKYSVHRHKNPLHYGRSLLCHQPLDIDAMNTASEHLIGRQEFTSFARLQGAQKHDFCDVRTAGWSAIDDQLIFEISADRFLRNMVRAIVGTLLDIGKGKMPPEAIKEVIAAKDRSAAGSSAAAHGLSLDRVEYPYIGRHVSSD
jgi:tRNA pseudouridine38-40 synthase